MKKMMMILVAASMLLLSGCAAIVQGGATLKAMESKEHPAKVSAVVASGKNEVFTAATRVLAGRNAKVTSSDRESGIVQALLDDCAITITVNRKSAKESLMDVSVAYAATYLYGDPKMEEKAESLKSEIEQLAKTLPVVAEAAVGVVEKAVPVAKVASKKKRAVAQ